MSNLQIRLIYPIVWLATLSAAYYFGKQNGGDSSTSDSPVQVVTNRPDGLPASVGSFANSSLPGESGAAGKGKGKDGNAIDVRALIAQARSQIGAGGKTIYNSTAMMKAMAPMADFSEAQVREALEEVEATVTNPQQKSMFYSLLLGRLAETDGAAAMAYADENLQDQGGYGTGVTLSIISGWASRDPDAAWKWYVENREEDTSNGFGYGQVSALFTAIASKNVDLAFSRLGQLGDLERGQAVSGIAQSGAWEPGIRDQILAQGKSLPDDTRRTLYQGIASQWAMMDPDGALAWMDSLPAEERKPLVQQAGSMLMMSNPKRGAELMLENASAPELPQTYSRIVGMWSARDPNAAGEWLNQLPKGPELDQARSSFARNVVRRDPESAMEWAKTVENADQRLQTVQQVYSQWKGKDTPAADAALNGSGLPAEQIATVRENASKQPNIRLGGGGAIQIFR